MAAELALAGVDVMVVERRDGEEVDGSRAGGLHSRTIEVLDQRGVAERFLSEGQVMQTNGYAMIPLDISDFPTRHPYGLALWQRDFERIMAAWLDELGVDVRRGREVVGVRTGEDEVAVSTSDGTEWRARYVVGCDGGRSRVRKLAGIDFPGLDASMSWMIAEVEMDRPELGMRPEGGGVGPVNRDGGEGGPYRVVLTEAGAGLVGIEPDLDDLRAALVERYGHDLGVHSPTWISRFTDATRQAAAYRQGRLLLAGDAAHIHPPQGGQGLNTGVQDAVNLGWKLALVVAGHAPDDLLDSYHQERHPIGAAVLRATNAQRVLTDPDPRHRDLHAAMAEVLVMDGPRRHLAGMLSGLALHYELDSDEPLVGRRAPDLDLVAPEGPTTLFRLLHDARPVLMEIRPDPGAPGEFRPVLAAWGERVRSFHGRCDGPWVLPGAGEVDTPETVLVRPDGHVAWAGPRHDREGLMAATQRWFGTA